MNTQLTLSMGLILGLAIGHALLACACAGGDESLSMISQQDASADGLYTGGGSIIPSTHTEGGSTYGGGRGYGSPDGSGLSPCPRDAAAIDASKAPSDADSDVGTACTTSLGPGDLIIDELMIASQSGSGDHGEWMEVASTRDCVIDLKGLYAQVPHGKGTTIAMFSDDVFLPPHGFFVIADSAEPSENHDLPGNVFVWGSGTQSDVLLNSGDDITLYTASATIDMLTYPDSSKLVDGASMAFPFDCEPSARLEFGNWQPSVASWTPGFFGTPMAPNTDVTCPVLAPSPPSSPCGG
jgi:hypothetical protein